jgi:CRP-like cAMP-binding protein
MRAKSFIDKLQEFQKLPDEVVEEIISRVKKVHLHKRTMVLKEGQVCENIYFIDKGLARSYYTSEGKDYTTDICLEESLWSNFQALHIKPPPCKIWN